VRSSLFSVEQAFPFPELPDIPARPPTTCCLVPFVLSTTFSRLRSRLQWTAVFEHVQLLLQLLPPTGLAPWTVFYRLPDGQRALATHTRERAFSPGPLPSGATQLPPGNHPIRFTPLPRLRVGIRAMLGSTAITLTQAIHTPRAAPEQAWHSHTTALPSLFLDAASPYCCVHMP